MIIQPIKATVIVFFHNSLIQYLLFTDMIIIQTKLHLCSLVYIYIVCILDSVTSYL